MANGEPPPTLVPDAFTEAAEGKLEVEANHLMEAVLLGAFTMAEASAVPTVELWLLLIAISMEGAASWSFSAAIHAM